MRLSILFLSLFASVCAVQAETVSRPVSFEIGETLRISVVKESKHWQQGKLVRDERFSTTEIVEFIEKVEDGYLVRMTVDHTVLETQDDGRREYFESMVRALEDASMDFETDEAGRPVQARNWKSVIEAGISTFHDKSPDASPKVAASVKSGFASSLKYDDAWAVASYGRNLAMVTAPHNIELKVGVPVSYSATSPNPFGGQLMEFEAKATLISASNGIAIIEIQEEASEESIERTIQFFLSRMKVPEDAVQTMHQHLDQHGASVSFVSRFEVGLDNGRTTKVTQQRRMQMGSFYRAEVSKVLEATYSN
jgi:hypothetical protein